MESNKCIYCNKSLRKIKNDFKSRNSHKKCYRDNAPCSGLYSGKTLIDTSDKISWTDNDRDKFIEDYMKKLIINEDEGNYYDPYADY